MSKIQVIQGVNLESTNSIIKIPISKNKEVLEIVKLIESFHPIFIKKYKFEENVLKIESRITSLWREIGEILLKLDSKKISKENAKKIIVEEIIKQRISSMSTIAVLEAAIKHNVEITPTLLKKDRVKNTKSFNRHLTLGAGKGSQIIYSISSSKDSKVAKEIQRDKWATNLMIERMGLPIPKWEVIEKPEEIEKIWEQYEKPVVIKPTGLTGGKGVSTGIETIEQAKTAYQWAKKAIGPDRGMSWQEKIMIQEQVPGEDYRLLIVNGKLEIATKRIPAFIVGDGHKCIKELIEETNKDPRRDTTKPSHTLKPIKINEPLLNLLKENNLTLESVPEKDQKVVLRKVASMSQGGITEDFTDKVSPEIKSVVESLSSSIHAFVVGADVLCKDISKPLTKENGAILEINTMPEAYLNLYPVIGQQRNYVADTYIKKLLQDNKTKKIVVVGHFSKDIQTVLKEKNILGNSYLDEEDTIGEYINGEIKINGLDINKAPVKWQAIEALKVNASLNAIIIHHRDWDEVGKDGLGFDQIDLLITNYKTPEVKRLKRKGFINKIKILNK